MKSYKKSKKENNFSYSSSDSERDYYSLGVICYLIFEEDDFFFSTLEGKPIDALVREKDIIKKNKTIDPLIRKLIIDAIEGKGSLQEMEGGIA